MPSSEQSAIVAHPATSHGRVLAGPGTGKSTTVLELAERLAQDGAAVQVITFTRAATAELMDKIRAANHKVAEPATVHGFALSLLLRNPSGTKLPQPLRVPDEWETQNLIHPYLAAALRRGGFSKKTGFSKNVAVSDVQRLEREMAAGWESLDPSQILLADLDPELRSLYLANWQAHRTVFGYSLFAEMPLYARNLLEDRRDAKLGKVDLLVVDEYQDLNRCELALVEAVAKRGACILAVGDDDQSIYSWRMAHPRGIREFEEAFPGAANYPLSISFRCGRRILTAARSLIESTPGRPSKPSLKPGPSNAEGVFHYLRFWNQDAERAGIARLAKHLVRKHGVKPDEIAVLMRADHNGVWSKPLRKVLSIADVPSVDVEAALEPLFSSSARRVLALGRLVVNGADDLAWWTLFSTTPGVSDELIRSLSDACQTEKVRFGARLATLADAPPADAPKAALRKAIALVGETRRLLAGIDQDASGNNGDWGEWLIAAAAKLGIGVDESFKDLVRSVGSALPAGQALTQFLSQLEPAARDIALRTPGVAIMTMARSKGLTFKATFVMGVEEGVVPLSRASDEEEERRLLYVAMTRAREFLFLTMSARREDATGRSGAGFVRDRSRCPFFDVLGISPIDGDAFLSKPSCC